MNSALWNTYDSVREKLERQYTEPFFPADTGITVEELEKQVKSYLKEHVNEPRIRLRAGIFSYLLENARIRVDDFDWFADHIDTGNIMRKLQNQWMSEARAKIAVPHWDDELAGYAALDLSHTSPGWRNLLEYGICGIRDRAREAIVQAKDDEAREFYNAVATVYEAIRKYILRLADEAEKRGAIRVIDCLRSIAEQPPQTFHESLQLSFIYNQMQEIESENVRTQGIFDRLYIDYYRRDLAAGRLTREQAKELIKFYFDKYQALHFGAGKNICFGGKNPDGSDSCNELTGLALEVFEERGTIDPKLSLRVHDKLPEHILRHACRCVANGSNSIVFANDEAAYPMFLKRGKNPEELIDFVPVGCYEPAIMGREVCCSMSAWINLVKVIELMMDELDDPKNINEVTAAYLKCLGKVIDKTLARTREWETYWPEVNPSPVMSGTMEGCLEKGRDISHAGTLYNNSGVMCAGIGTVADALAALDYLVFKQKLCSWHELRDILKTDWNGHEKLRLTAQKRASKWGNNLSDVDRFAVAVTEYSAKIINHTPNTRNGYFQMGCWSIDHAVNMGRETGATPDGRKSGTPLSKNVGASIAADTRGVTALLNSACKLDHTEFPDGSVLDVMLHPSVLKGTDGAELIAKLIRTYFHEGGLFTHFNIFDADTLKKARQKPEKYRNLQVRVCGWNSRFIDLTTEMQETFIAQAEALS